MERSKAKDGKTPININWKKDKLQKFIPFIKIFNVKYFKICHRIITIFVFTSFLMNVVIGEIAHEINSKIVVTNQNADIGRKLFSNKSDINIFYNNSNNINGDERNDRNINNTSTCLKEHRIKEREVKEGERRKRESNKKRKERSNEREKSSSRPRQPEEADDASPPKEEAQNKPSNFGCHACMREEMRSMSLEAIKGSILSKLGMSQPPNLKGRPKPKIGDHRLAELLGRRHPHHGSSGVFWFIQEDEFEQMQEDEFEQMQGDEPYGGDSSDKVSGKNSEFSNKSNALRSHGYASENRYSETGHFQEGEVLMEEEDDYHVRTEKIVSFSQPYPRIRHSPHVQYFQFSDKMRNSKVKKAVLWIYIRGRESVNVAGDKITITIYKILDIGKSGSTGSRESPVITHVLTNITQNVPNGAGAWIALDYIKIKNLVAEWFRYPQHNLGVIITAEDANRTNLAVTSHNGNGTAFVPFLEVYVTDYKKHRTKRTIGLNCNDSSNETRCCRYPLTVNFEEFGWDWIIAPKKYEANYCSGECPFVFLTRHPHTHVMQLADVPGAGPCCAPRKLSAISMLYFDQNMNIILGTVPDMVVDRCGCA